MNDPVIRPFSFLSSCLKVALSFELRRLWLVFLTLFLAVDQALLSSWEFESFLNLAQDYSEEENEVHEDDRRDTSSTDREDGNIGSRSNSLGGQEEGWNKTSSNSEGGGEGGEPRLSNDHHRHHQSHHCMRFPDGKGGEHERREEL